MTEVRFVLPNFRPGGAERSVLILAKALSNIGYVVSFLVMSLDGVLLDEARTLGPVYDLKTRRLRKVPLALARHLRYRPTDVLIAGWWPLTGMANLGVRLSGVKTTIILVEHTNIQEDQLSGAGWRSVLIPWLLPLLTRGGNHVAVSSGVRSSLIEHGRLDPNEIEVIANPIRPLHNPPTVPEDLSQVAPGWADAGLRLISIGTLKPEKGFDVALTATAELAKRHDVHHLFLGEGPERANLEALAQRLGITDRVHLISYRPEPARYLIDAHMLVASSHYEGFGMMILDALQCGVPVVSTDCRSGPSEILCGGRLGTLVPVSDPVALALGVEAERAARRDPRDLRRRAQDFAPDRIAARYAAMFDASRPDGRP